MANFVVIVDQDFQRRSQFLKTIEPLLPPIDELITNSCSTEDFHAIWSANRTAPISSIADEEGAGVIWGDAIIPNSTARIDANSLRQLWRNPQNQPPIFDGFYAAVVYHPHLGLRVGADLLGIFPVYYYTCKDVILVASSQELFRYHPLFQKQFNPAGLVGILLTNGLFNGQTLWKNVKHLGAGNLLTWQPTTSAQEIKQYHIGDDSQNYQYSDLSFSDYLDILDQVIDKTITRHAPKEFRHGILLSGGLDSRTLVGYLHKQGIDTLAFTFGIPHDLEVGCARSVARTLKLEHHLITVPFSNYPTGAKLMINWDHLASGFNWLTNWNVQSDLRRFVPRVVFGASIETLAGAKVTGLRHSLDLSFEMYFKRGINGWSLNPEVLEKLLHKDVFGDLVQETIAQIRQLFQSYSDSVFKQVLLFDLYHRQRFHVGSGAWQYSFGAWPVLPVLDRELIEATIAFPPETVLNRKAQNQLLCTRFPKLAQLPLDSLSYYKTDPLKPNPFRRRLSILFKWQQKWRKLQYKLGYERRYFQRTLDINNMGWRMVRKEAESYRPLVKHLFDETVLNQLVPKPDSYLKRVKGLENSSESGIKALLGFLLWSKDHL